jgi:hypothetical protein
MSDRNSNAKLNFIKETSLGIEQLLRDYSVESISVHLAKVNAGDNSFFTQIEPLTDFHVSHRRVIIDQEYQDFLEKTQRVPGVSELFGLRSERLSSEDISASRLMNTASPNEILGAVQPRPERDNIPLQESLADPYIRNLFLQNSIRIVESTSQVRQSSLKEVATEGFKSSENFITAAQLAKLNRTTSQFFSETKSSRAEKYPQLNSSSTDFESGRSWFQDAVNRIKDASRVIQEASQNRPERLNTTPEQKTSSTSTVDSSQNRQQTRLEFDGKTIKVYRGDESKEPSLTCPAISGSDRYKPLPEGNYCVRAQGEAQNSGGWNPKARIAELTGGALFANSRRSEWFLLEPQFSAVEPRARLDIHAGYSSNGCATVTNRDCFLDIAELLEASTPSTGLGYDGYPPGNPTGVTNPLNQVTCVATLTVNYSGEQGVVQRNSTTRVAPDRAETYGLGITPKERRGYGLGVSDTYTNSKPQSRASGTDARKSENYNLGVDIPGLPSTDYSRYSPELLRSTNSKEQNTSSSQEQSTSSDSGRNSRSNSEAGRDRPQRDNTGSGYDYAGPDRPDSDVSRTA